MNKLGALGVAVVAVLLVIHYQKTSVDVEPEVMSEDVWWGSVSDRDPAANGHDLRPFQINITAEVVRDLKHRLSNVRRPAKPLENVNFEYGFNSDRLMEILDHWSNRYDWTARQAYLNSLPQFKTNVYGLDVHFVRVKPSATAANVRTIPLLMLHGWPGSVAEFYKIIPMLTRKTDAHDFVFEVIAPSLPGYGFSDAAVRPGMGAAHVGQVFVKLMERLGHMKFYVQGGDWGAKISEAMSKLFPKRIYGMHSNMCSMADSLTINDYIQLLLGTYWPSLIVSSETEKTRTYPLGDVFSSFLEESGFMHLQMTKPDTAGVALSDSPAGLAAYILEKFSTWTNFNFKHLPDGGLSKYDMDELLDNVMIYWVTGSMTTSMRLYAESSTKKYLALPHAKAKVKVPVACAIFPFEMSITFALKKFLPKKYVNLISTTEMKDGGHFAAFEQPELLAQDIWSSVSKMEKIRNKIQ